ncbi:MAG: peptidylprolyl isomerase [candidate division KSB1 bacterium]|nr:peptidylprolyl isomerase [candidate division KSB1 bacterium]
MARKASLLLIVSALVISACQRTQDPIVARVGNRVIRLSEFEQDFSKNRTPNFIKTTTFKERKDHLMSMVERTLKIADAYSRHYDRLPEVVQPVEREMEQRLFSSYVEKKVVDRLVTEAEMQDYWRKSSVQLRVRHLLLVVPRDADEHTEAEVRKRAWELRDRILKGESFFDVAKNYSQDHMSSTKGGDLGFIRWGEGGYDDAFFQAAFSLKEGELSTPIRTQRGYHILRVEGKQVSGLGEYEQAKDRIKDQLLKTKQAQLEKEYYRFAEELERRYKVQYDSTAMAALVAKLARGRSDTTTASPVDQDVERDQFHVLTQADHTIALARYVGGSVTVGDIVNMLRRYPVRRQPRLTAVEVVKDWTSRLLWRQLAIREARREKFHSTPEMKRTRQQLLERSMLQRITDDMVRKRMNLTEDSYKAYFEAHRDAYKNPARAKVQEIFLSDRKQAEQLLRRIRAGESFSRLARQYTERTSVRNQDGVLGYISARQYGNVGKTALEMAVGQVSDVIPMGPKFSIIKVLDREEESFKTYEQALYDVQRDLRRQEEERLKSEWLEGLRKRFRVTIYDEAMKKAFANLFEE